MINNTRTVITYLKTELKYLAVGDVLDHSSMHGQCYETIRRIEPMWMGTRSALLEDQHGGLRAVTLTSVGMHTVVSGEKLTAARQNPALVKTSPSGHPVWKGG